MIGKNWVKGTSLKITEKRLHVHHFGIMPTELLPNLSKVPNCVYLCLYSSVYTTFSSILPKKHYIWQFLMHPFLNSGHFIITLISQFSSRCTTRGLVEVHLIMHSDKKTCFLHKIIKNNCRKITQQKIPNTNGKIINNVK